MTGQTSGAPAGRCSDGKTNAGTCLRLPRLRGLAGAVLTPAEKTRKKSLHGSIAVLNRGTNQSHTMNTSTTNSALAMRENELRTKFANMTSQEIREMMNSTDNTTTKLICWEYLQTL